LTAGNLRGIEIATVFREALPHIFKILIRVPGLSSPAFRNRGPSRSRSSLQPSESTRSPNGANWRSGVHLASKSHGRKSFIFIEGRL
jgi:hypothetical protein